MNKSFFISKNCGATYRRWFAHLSLQANLFADKEIKLLKNFGFARHKTILDIGCGIGTYSQILKKAFPHLKIYATDTSNVFLDEFRRRIKNNKDIKLFNWDANKSEVPDEFKKCDAVILRLVLQHLEDPFRVLSLLRNTLRPKTRLYIIEEDNDLFQVYPELPAYHEVVTAMKKYGEKYICHRYLGRMLPQLLRKAGLRVNNFEILSHSNFDVDIKQLINFFVNIVRIMPDIVSPQKVKKISADFNRFYKTNHNDCLLLYPQVVVCAEVPFLAGHSALRHCS